VVYESESATFGILLFVESLLCYSTKSEGYSPVALDFIKFRLRTRWHIACSKPSRGFVAAGIRMNQDVSEKPEKQLETGAVERACSRAA
jgi:hypothetical protein